jgi:hypothetical protein
MPMDGKISQLSPDDHVYLDGLRGWVKAHLNEENRHEYDNLEAKLFLVQNILQKKLVSPDETETLQALGVAFGDALAQKNGLIWVTVQYDDARLPELLLPETTLKVGAFTMIQKRVQTGEEFDVYSLFDAVCLSIEKIKSKLTGSFLSRAFQRIAGAFRM